MNKRIINGTKLNPIGLGCMNLSHAYGQPPSEKEASYLLSEAIEMGINHFDTAALYGFSDNEKLLGKYLKPHRQNIFLASKCGMKGVNGKRVINGRPEILRQTIEESLTNLQTDVLDLYYLHRWDKTVPIEESVGELSRMVKEGKIKAIGLSEVSAPKLHKAYKIHPIAALQTEYSLWTRNPEISVLNACKDLNTAFVAFSPLGRGFLSGNIKSAEYLIDGDIRKGMPRFQLKHAQKNHGLLTTLLNLSNDLNCSPAQLCLSWLLHQNDYIIPIPGTTKINHLRDNINAVTLKLTKEQLAILNKTFNHKAISGERYPLMTQQEIDTEEFR
jgi:aryl-alcohol dehydrogenase-like predicted oxidoreductase